MGEEVEGRAHEAARDTLRAAEEHDGTPWSVREAREDELHGLLHPPGERGGDAE